MSQRQYSFFDGILAELDNALRTVHATPSDSGERTPAENLNQRDEGLSEDDQKLSGRLMRVNHSGEVAAQGLYRGQALRARNDETRAKLQQSASEENDHLNWCSNRLQALESRPSLLNPLWYWGSFAIGAAAGAAGDRWSLGFVKETEDQVARHIDNHLERLPASDITSRSVLLQMKEDEEHHAQVAVESGAERLPLPIRKVVMPLTSKVMTTLSERI